jgi:beta-N-acetylhexosaminidase
VVFIERNIFMRRTRFFICLGWLVIGCAARPAVSPAAEIPRADLEHRVGQMLLIGFRGTKAVPGGFILETLRRYHIGGVILFDYDVPSKSFPRNILHPGQVKALIRDLQAAAGSPLLVAVDAEGGRVNRLKPDYGFLSIPGAGEAAGLPRDKAEKIYRRQAAQLAGLGFNCNLAPVVDLDLNPENPVIGGLGRAFSRDPRTVIEMAGIVIRAHRDAGVLTCLKHFPGHGSAGGDTHLGLVDVTKTWKNIELEPFRALIRAGLADLIMTAHILDRRVDPARPATLSPAFLRDRLRGALGFRGVVVSDDIQMGAVTTRFGEAEAAVQAVRAGCDILAVANNGRTYDEAAVGRIFTALVNAVKSGDLSGARIDESYARILRLKLRLGPARRPPARDPGGPPFISDKTPG